MTARRVLLLAALAAAGCGRNTPPDPLPAAPEPAPDVTPLGPDNGSLIRGSKEPAPQPPPAPPAPKPGEIVIPTGGGSWPAELPAAAQPRVSKPVPIPDYSYPESTTAGLAVRASADRAVVCVSERFKDKEKQTRVVWCDTAAGKVVGEWTVDGIYTVLDVHPDGRRALATRPAGLGQPGVLELWAFDGEHIRVRRWQPHASVPAAGPEGALVLSGGTDPNDPGRLVRWAAFVGPNRIASASAAGQFRTFDAESLARTGTVEALPGVPSLTPDGRQVVFPTKAGVALFDPVDGKVIGVKAVPGFDLTNAAVAVSPDGKRLGCAANGRLAVVELGNGAARVAEVPSLEVLRGGVPLAFGWAGEGHLFADHFLFDPARAALVWDYGNADRLLVRGREAWAVLRPSNGVAMVRAFPVPHPAIRDALTTAGDGPGRSTVAADRLGDVLPGQ